MTELGCIRFAALSERRSEFGVLIGFKVAAQQNVMRHPGQPAHTAMPRVEGGLDPKCQRSTLRDLESVFSSRVLQFVIRHNHVDETPLERFPCADLRVPIPDVLRTLLSDEIL